LSAATFRTARWTALFVRVNGKTQDAGALKATNSAEPGAIGAKAKEECAQIESFGNNPYRQVWDDGRQTDKWNMERL
jgi:hypothetical protein